MCPGKQRTEAQLSVTVLLEVAQPSGVIANGSLEGYDVKKKVRKTTKTCFLVLLPVTVKVFSHSSVIIGALGHTI